MKKVLAILILSIFLFGLNAPAYALIDLEEREAEREAEEKEEAPAKEPKKEKKAEEKEGSDKEFGSLVDQLVPSSSELFEGREDVRLAEGDLETGLVPRLIRILISFSALAAFVLFMYSGIRLVLARHNEEELTKAKTAIIHAVVGAILIAGSFGIIIGLIRLFESF